MTVCPQIFEGLERYEAREKCWKPWRLLSHTQETVIAMPYGDRSGVVIEWYLDANILAGGGDSRKRALCSRKLEGDL